VRIRQISASYLNWQQNTKSKQQIFINIFLELFELTPVDMFLLENWFIAV